MKLTIIVGSHRPNSQSLKVANYILERVKALDLFNSFYVLNLAETEIPFWDEGVWKKEEKWQSIWNPIANEMSNSDAFIVISPEWGGMVPAKLKNLFLLSNTSIMGNKPALLVSVSSGFAGSYPINELRTSSYKNTKICYIPDHIIIRKVEECLNSEINLNSEHDSHIRPRIDYAISLLKHYSTALLQLRSINFNFDEYKYGM